MGLLKMSLYGTRDAANNWQEEIAKFMLGDGFTRGKYNPCLYWHPKRRVKSLVHGDDFVSVGRRSAVYEFNRRLASRFEIKTCVIGTDTKKGEVSEGKVLNRMVRCTDQGFELEADPCHAEIIIEQLGLNGTKGVASREYCL